MFILSSLRQLLHSDRSVLKCAISMLMRRRNTICINMPIRRSCIGTRWTCGSKKSMRNTAVRPVRMRRSLFKIRCSDEAVVFNRELRMDLVLDVIDREPSLDIIDVGTGFLAAVFLNGQDASTVWNAL
jgi:hypothetical protein